MHPSLRRLLAALALVALLPCMPGTASAAANHVVISEIATRGSTAATDEFVELYNPTDNAISLAGWKTQYKSATGTTWNDRSVLPANASIPAHGFYLIANQSYIGAVTPDYSSGLWNSGTGMADNGHVRLLDASAVEVDKVGFGSTAIDPEGGVTAPNHGTSANNNSIERKANPSSTAALLATGGAHQFLGNGEDSNVNGSDFVAQSFGRNPQNTATGPEPAFASGGSGTGHATITPAIVYAGRSLDSLHVAFTQDSAHTIATIAMLVPASWTWGHSAASVALEGPAFAAATPSVSGDTVFVTGAALTTTDSGTLHLLGVTTPSANGATNFTTRTAVAAGTLTPIAPQPSVRVLDLVPIVAVHVNDANGVPTSPYGVGAEATVTGIVTANLNTTRTDVYVQDITGGINLFNAALGPITLAPGDSITVTGSILQFRGLTEIQPDFALLVRHATGRPVPEPLVITAAGINSTFHVDGTEPNEGRLIRVNGCTYNSVNSTITDATGTTLIFVPASFPAPPSVFDVIGILKQFKPGTPAPGPPYTADYEIAPRTPDDIIPHPGPILTVAPYEDQIQPTSVRINWTTDVSSTSVVRYGLTSALGDSVVVPTGVLTHAVTIPGLTPATVYYYAAGSEDVNGANFSTTRVFSTASPAATTGQVNVYFNKSVNTSVAVQAPANGNQDLVARLTTRLDNAKRSIDAAIYSLSGTAGGNLATALIAAKNRGVKVRVICEYDNSTSTGFTALAGAGIPLINDRFDTINFGAGLMHDKFFVVDARGGAPESTWVWTGSWNPTDPGTNNDMQNAIELQDQALANVFRMEFEEMWGSSTDTPNAAASRFGARKLDDTPHKFVVGGRPVEAYFSPSDGTNFQIYSAILAAEHSVGFELLTITRSDLAAALINRHTAGVKVRGNLDASTDTGSEYGTLVTAGVDVRLKTGVSGLLHHKYMIADAENPTWNGVTVTGSHNWSAAAENSNNENTLVIRDPAVANQYLQEFTARYYQFGGTDSIHVTAVGDGPSNGLAWLGQNYPNPFVGSTQIAYAIPVAQKVSLKLYDVMGREVRTLVDQVQPAGRYQLTMTTRGLPAGVYLARLNAGGQVRQSKMLLLQ